MDNKIEVLDIEHTPQGVKTLKKALKEGKVIRNPFANSFKKGYSIIVQNPEFDRIIEISTKPHNT